jgi:hypothetical protein
MLLFSQNGTPRLVTNVDQNTKNYQYTESTSEIQKHHPRGIKNAPDQTIHQEGTQLLENLHETSQTIEEALDRLNDEINLLKKSNINPAMLSYLNSELHYQMLYHNYTPKNFFTSVDELNVLYNH